MGRGEEEGGVVGGGVEIVGGRREGVGGAW